MLDANKLYELLKQIPKGRVTTYGAIAKQLESKAFRGVGRIVGLNPNAPHVPCHRVVRSDGGISGYAFGVDKKITLLRSEGIEVLDGKIKDFNEKLFTF